MVNEPSNRVRVRPDQGNPMSKPSSSLKDTPKTPKASKTKGIVSKTVLNQKKAKARKYANSVVPKFDTIDGINCCIKCKKGNHLTDAIVCQVCNSTFHALCKFAATGPVDETAICTPSFLTSVSPVIAKYGTNAKRWGNFMFVCVKCNDEFKTFMESKKVRKKTMDLGVNTDPAEVDQAPISATLIADDEDRAELERQEELITEVIDQVQTVLKGFENGILSRVDSMLDEKLSSSCNLFNTVNIRRAPTPSSSSGISSIVSFDPDLASSEHSISTPLPAPFYSSVLTSASKEFLQPSSKKPADASTKSATEREIELMRHNTELDNESMPRNTEKDSLVNSPKPDKSENMPQEEDSSHILVLSAQNDTVNLHKAEEKLNNLFKNVPINHIKNNINSKKIVMIFPSAKAKEKGRKVLEQHPDVLNKGLNLSDARKMFPKITVTNIPNYLVEDILSKDNLDVPTRREKLRERLELMFLEKNEHVQNLVQNHGRTFRIIFVNPGQNFITVGIKVSPDIRNFLIDANWIHIGNTRCKVTDRFDLKQCFKCQKFGHLSDQCRESNTVCKYCGASHQTRTCPHKHDQEHHRCTNCSHSNIDNFKALCHTHHSASDSCPIIMLEKDKLRKKTEYSKNM